MRFKAELRKREDGYHGVIWPVDARGEPVGDKQLEMALGPAELGARLYFNLYIKELVKQPGWSFANPYPTAWEHLGEEETG